MGIIPMNCRRCGQCCIKFVLPNEAIENAQKAVANGFFKNANGKFTDTYWLLFFVEKWIDEENNQWWRCKLYKGNGICPLHNTPFKPSVCSGYGTDYAADAQPGCTMCVGEAG